MALGACAFFKSDIGVATTGYAEPCPAQNVKEPFAFWALTQVRSNGSSVVLSGRVDCAGTSRVEAQQRVADAVLGELIKYLVRLRG